MTDDQTLIEAVQSGDGAQVEALLQANSQLAETCTPEGLSALLLAVYSGQNAIAAHIAACRDLDLFEAAATGNEARALHILNQYPERIDAANVDGFTPLGLAAYFGHADVVDLLLGAGATVDLASRNGDMVTPLHSAAAGRHVEIARMLIERGANVNARQNGGFTPLHSAAQNGDHKLIALLLEHGADRNAKTDDGKGMNDFLTA